VTASAGLAGLDCRNGAASADFDNDGRPDLLLLHDRKGRDHLLRNEGTHFLEVTGPVGISTEPAQSVSAVWFDFDKNGWLDLYLVQNGDLTCSTIPALGQIAPPGGIPNRLYRNEGGRFQEVGAHAGVAVMAYGMAAASFDFDNDGWPDLDVLNDFGRNLLYRNEGDGTFREVSHRAGVGCLGNGMGVSVADYDQDGHLDLFLTYIGYSRPYGRTLFPAAHPMLRTEWAHPRVASFSQRNRLYRNRGDGTFEDVSEEAFGDVPTGWGWNGFFLDADNRGWTDLYIVTGWWPGQLFYADEAKVLLRFDPAAGRFGEEPGAGDADFAGESRLSAYADLDGDGCLDLLVTGFHPIRLFAGNCPSGNHWLEARLKGVQSNRDGIGARVVLRAGSLVQTAEMGPQGGGFQNSLLRVLHFGLGEHPRVDSIEVRWPSGIVQTIENVAADQRIEIAEPADAATDGRAGGPGVGSGGTRR